MGRIMCKIIYCYGLEQNHVKITGKKCYSASNFFFREIEIFLHYLKFLNGGGTIQAEDFTKNIALVAFLVLTPPPRTS